MKTEVINRNMFVSWGIVVLIVASCSIVYSHCQIPCGIYDDDMRFDMMAEHVATIEKSMQMVNQISGEQKPDMNQLVRWVQNKESHADELSHIISYYFMAQRVKPAEKTDSEKYDIYLVKLTLLHRMLVTSMKAKQTTDVSVTKELTDLLTKFKGAYYGEHNDQHEH